MYAVKLLILKGNQIVSFTVRSATDYVEIQLATEVEYEFYN